MKANKSKFYIIFFDFVDDSSAFSFVDRVIEKLFRNYFPNCSIKISWHVLLVKYDLNESELRIEVARVVQQEIDDPKTEHPWLQEHNLRMFIIPLNLDSIESILVDFTNEIAYIMKNDKC